MRYRREVRLLGFFVRTQTNSYRSTIHLVHSQDDTPLHHVDLTLADQRPSRIPGGLHETFPIDGFRHVAPFVQPPGHFARSASFPGTSLTEEV
jgi:hypothetical protein